MNFQWAIEQLSKGKKVRMKSWISQNSYMYENNRVIFSSSGSKAYFMISHFTAEDWELYEDDFCLSNRMWRGATGAFSGRVFLEKDIKEFIKRLKDNFSEFCSNSEIKIIDKLAGLQLTK